MQNLHILAQLHKYPQVSVIDKSFDYFFNSFISLDLDGYYIPFIDYRNNRAKVSTSVDKVCQLFHMHPNS